MRVLLMESDPHEAETAASTLEAAGHEVVRCFDPDLGTFPCRALYAGERCPLDDDRGVDVALDVRAHGWAQPAPGERGVVCAIRAGVPLVTAGIAFQNPFERFATATVEPGGDPTAACVAAASTVHEPESSVVVMPGTSVAAAIAALVVHDATAALVSDRGRPIGVATLSALRGQAGSFPHPSAVVSDVMDWECVPIEPGAGIWPTLRSFTDAAWTSLRRRRPDDCAALTRRPPSP